RVRVLGAEDAAEAAGRDLVEDLVAAHEVAVHVPFEDLGRLEVGDVAAALQDAGEVDEGRHLLAALLAGLVEGLVQLRLRDQPDLDGQRPEMHRFGDIHESTHPAGLGSVRPQRDYSNLSARAMLVVVRNADAPRCGRGPPSPAPAATAR